MTFRLYLLALAGLATIAAGCAGLLSRLGPKVEGVRPRITGIDFEGVNLNFDVSVRNPYPVAIRTPSTKYRMLVQDCEIASSQTTAKMSLPAAGVGSAAIPLRVTYGDLIRAARGLAGANEAPYRFEGAFLLNAMGKTVEVPFQHTGKVPLLRLPKLAIAKVHPADISLRGAKLKIDAAIANPNVFGVDFSKLGYQLTMGGVPIGQLQISSIGKVKAGGKGRVALNAQLSTVQAGYRLLSAGKLWPVQLAASGSIATPYGEVRLAEALKAIKQSTGN